MGPFWRPASTSGSTASAQKGPALKPTRGDANKGSEGCGTSLPVRPRASKRKRDRILDAERRALAPQLRNLLPAYSPQVQLRVTENGSLSDERRIDIGVASAGPRLSLTDQDDGTFLMPAVEKLLYDRGLHSAPPASVDEWRDLLNEDTLRELLDNSSGSSVSSQWFTWQLGLRNSMKPEMNAGESEEDYQRRLLESERYVTGIATTVVEKESRLAAALLDLVRTGAQETLTSLFYAPAPSPEELAVKLDAINRRLTDPFLEFDPTDALNGVTVSPVGIVHLYRQYFFEFDSFLGPSVQHVWLPPGATAELIETSTRRTTIERTTTSEFESTTQIEREERVEDELSSAVRQENREDSKLGFSTTVTQGWPAGSATATGSLNLDTTQQMSREEAYKRLREQTSKLSTKIRNSFKTTFKTITETTDVASKRLILQNEDKTKFQNYELRRKMRQVGVQVQDVGTYLCWETFVDDPGAGLGLSNLVHIAKPPEITPIPNPGTTPVPERKSGVTFQIRTAWVGSDNRRYPGENRFGIPLGRKEMPIDIPDGYEVGLKPGEVFQLQAASASGEGGESFRTHTYLAQFVGGRELDVGLSWGPGGLRWTHEVTLELTGSVTLVPTAARVNEINAANQKILDEHEAKTRAAEAAATEAAFYKSAQERIEQAASIKPRRFEDLREEERTIIYRELIRDLMAKDSKTGDDNYTSVDPARRHVYATVLNAIFDIDAMLYFVAPEWWKPRPHSDLFIGSNPDGSGSTIGTKNLVGWTDSTTRQDNYYITAKSEPARLGSSLGWLLQLDADDNRNRFLNAPWVRAVIPIRPGKEEAAIRWLSNANVEGAEGLDASYAYPTEAEEITNGLAEKGIIASDPPTIRDAITYLSLKVTDKHEESTKTSLYPDRDGIDEGDKVWSTPVEKVYEHGFYPLERSFRANPSEEPADAKSRNYQVLAQWTEILPTDQIVPVSVEYDPRTGRLQDGT